MRKLDDWLDLSVIIGDPYCGLTLVKSIAAGCREFVEFTVLGDCHSDHDHAEAVAEGKQRLLTNRRKH